jgi:IMP dehydrogenase
MCRWRNKKPADIVKAIGAGAETVMVGNLFAGTLESPGEIIKRKGKKYKLYRGSASYDVSLKKKRMDKEEDKKIISVEGEKTLMLYKGSIKTIVEKLIGGMASGMTYMGAENMKKAVGKADFIEITPKGYEESIANGVNKTL